MKIIKQSNKTTLKMSRKEWEQIGKQAGWGDIFKEVIKPIVKPIVDAFEPDQTNPHIQKSEDDGSTHQLTKDYKDQDVLKTPASQIDIQDTENKLNNLSASDPELLLSVNKAIEFVKHPSKMTEQKVVDGMKIVLFRIANLSKGNIVRKQSVAILKKWFEQKIESEKMWEKPKNPYL